MLEHLARGQSPERALRALSRELRMLFVHAYQAWIFNRWLSQRWREPRSIAEAIDGDWIIRIHRNGTLSGADAVPVLPDNRRECQELIERGRARIAGPLVGFGTVPGYGRPGALLDELLRQEGVERRSFETPHTPEISSAGTWRPISLPIPPIGISSPSIASDPTRGGGDRPRFSFRSPEGRVCHGPAPRISEVRSLRRRDRRASNRGY